MDALTKLLETSLGTLSLGKICSAVITFIICYAIVKVILKTVNRLLDRAGGKLDAYFRNILKTALKWVLYVVMAVAVAEALGINTTSLVAAFSVVGLAVSLAVQNTLTNVAGGIMILVSKPFLLGDYIETDSLSGTVTEIGMSYTKLRTPDNKVISIPNGDLANTRVTDYSANPTRRVDFSFTTSYDSPIPTVKKALYEAMEETGLFLKEPAWLIEVKSYGESSIEFVARGWAESGKYWEAYFRMNEKVSESFAKYGVEMTYNHLNVHIRQETERKNEL